MPQNPDLQIRLSKDLNISRLTAQLLVNRGIRESGKGDLFLHPSLKYLHDPFLMKDMDKAVARITGAIMSGEKVVICGDYDVDGITSTSLLLLFLAEAGLKADFYIPERLKDGYGLNVDSIRRFSSRGIDLILTTDSGISNPKEIELARSLGIDVIVTDHHDVPAEIPPASAVLNPKQPDCNFPFNGLAGVGVAFNLVMALRSRLRGLGHFVSGVPNLKKYLDLVALGTIADVAPLVDVNRIMVKFGLSEIASRGRKGIENLIKVSGIRSRSITAEQVGYQLAPRINAAGRLNNADTAVKLLTTDSDELASELANTLNKENLRRKRIEKEILEDADSRLCSEELSGNGIVIASDKWHPGVIGIVASRLLEKFNCPVLLIAVEGDMGRGSARGVKGFDLIDDIRVCGELLESYGGHREAAGFSIKRDNIEEFKDIFIKLLESRPRRNNYEREINVDMIISLDELRPTLISEIDRIAPFGSSNIEPVLVTKDTHIIETHLLGSRHLKLRIKQKNEVWNAIGFQMGSMHPLAGHGFDIAFVPAVSEWKGRRTFSLRIKELQ